MDYVFYPMEDSSQFHKTNDAHGTYIEKHKLQIFYEHIDNPISSKLPIQHLLVRPLKPS